MKATDILILQDKSLRSHTWEQRSALKFFWFYGHLSKSGVFKGNNKDVLAWKPPVAHILNIFFKI